MNKEMKRGMACLFWLAVCLTAPAQYRSGYAELGDSETVRALRGHVCYLSSAALEGRLAGSEGELDAARYVYDQLSAAGADLLCGRDGDLFGIAVPAGDTLRSRNVAAVVMGYDQAVNDRYIVVGARMDNLGTHQLTVDGAPTLQTYSGANGNASGLALLIELARLVASHSILIRRSVVFVAFGASCQSFAGSWYFLNRSFPEAGKIDAMINLDMLGTGSRGFQAYTCSNPDMNLLLSSMAGQLQPVRPELTAAEPYPSDHRVFYSGEIPSVYFTSGAYPEHDTPRDVEAIIEYEPMEQMLEYLYNFTVTLANVADPPQFRTTQAGSRSDGRTYAWGDCDVKPTFMGHVDPAWFLEKWVYAYMKYPKEAVENGIQGRVHVEFAIDRNGSVTDVRVVRGVSPLLDAEAVKVIAASPGWKPGKVNGNKVKTYLTLAVDFRLERGGKGRVTLNKK